MLKSGNGDPKRCAENLLATVRGEVCYDRVRGIDPRIIDTPEDDAEIELEQDARWNIDTYEPRLSANSVDISVITSETGDFQLQMYVSDVDEDEEEL